VKQNTFYWNFFGGSIKKSLNKRLSPPLTKAVMNNGEKEYRLLIDRAPELGKGNPFSLNMYFACVFIGVWLGSGKALSPETMADIMTECLLRLKPFFGLINLNKPRHAKLVQYHMAEKYMKWCDKHAKDYPLTWEMTGNTENRRGVYYELHSCPICALCKQEGILEIMPSLCQLDTLMFSMMHGKLIRNQMIAAGGEMCDYWVIGDEENAEQNEKGI